MSDTPEVGEKATEESEWTGCSWRAKVVSSEKLSGS